MPLAPRSSAALRRLALLPLLPLAGNALAQSNVTIYGLMDVAVGKYDGTTARTVGTGATSRLGFRGAEDLGGGLKAIFQLETQISPDTGTQSNASTFWSGRSTVGLEGRFGRVTLGREVNPSHFVEAAADPFGQDGLPGGYGARGGISRGNGAPGAIDPVRMNNSINYAFTGAGFTVRAQTAAREGADPTGNRPYSASLIYAASQWQVGVSYVNPSRPNDHWAYLSGQYDFGVLRLHGGVGAGTNTNGQSIRNQIVGVNIPMAPGSVRVSYSRTKADDQLIQSRVALGYYHSLSKRTVLYADVVHDTKAGAFVYNAAAGWAPTGRTLGKTGYDVGLRHYF